jgi:DNA replication protein DnaC
MAEFRWYKSYPEDLEIVTYECPCADQIRLFKFFLNAGLGKSYQVLSWGDVSEHVFLENQEALDAIADYWQNSMYYVARGFGLMLYGGNGTGKTLLSSLLLKRLLTHGRGLDAYFTTFTTLLDRYAGGWSDKDAAAWFERRVVNAEVLVIDDVGKESINRTGMSSNALDNMMRTRVQHDRPTIFTTNLSMQRFRDIYAGSTWSLLTEKVLPYEIKGSYEDKSVGFRDQQLARHREELRQRLIRPIVWE